jgi:hypothetical protein
MNRTRTASRIAHAILAVVCLVAASSAPVSAADLSGTWDVDGNVVGNPVKYDCTLKQEGDKLTGTARLEGKDVPVTGTIAESTVTWSFDVEYIGSPLKLEFSGTLSSDADIKGTIAVAGVSGEFTAKRR